MKKLLFTLLLAAFILPYAAAQGKLVVGQKAPEWTFTDADKKPFTMDSWPGKVLKVTTVQLRLPMRPKWRAFLHNFVPRWLDWGCS